MQRKVITVKRSQLFNSDIYQLDLSLESQLKSQIPRTLRLLPAEYPHFPEQSQFLQAQPFKKKNKVIENVHFSIKLPNIFDQDCSFVSLTLCIFEKYMVNREMNVPCSIYTGNCFGRTPRQVNVLRMKTFIFSWVHEYGFVNFNSQQKGDFFKIETL